MLLTVWRVALGVIAVTALTVCSMAPAFALGTKVKNPPTAQGYIKNQPSNTNQDGQLKNQMPPLPPQKPTPVKPK